MWIIRKSLTHRRDYVFFASYVQPPPKPGAGLWSDTDETEKVNVALLSNFLTSLSTSSLLPKRFLLQTGGKHYGVHLGPTLSPMQESDPRFLAEPNFYFPQEDLLWSWAAENNVEWNVTRPGFIIGAVREAAMNIAYGLALYAAVQKELNAPLVFPGDADAWVVEKNLSSALLIAYHAEWAVLTSEAGNEVLNHADGGPFTYGAFWPVLAALHGLEYKVPEDDDAKYQTVTMPISPPPRGFGAAGKFRLSASFEGWAQTPEVLGAWKKLSEKYELIGNPFENPKDVFGLLDAEILGPWGRNIRYVFLMFSRE
jgi:nucleoside-diphosphate-sugar epimerase